MRRMGKKLCGPQSEDLVAGRRNLIDNGVGVQELAQVRKAFDPRRIM